MQDGWGSRFISDTNAAWQAVCDVYERARNSGETVPSNVTAWARQDIKKIGAWEYRVLSVTNKAPGQTMATLNELGAQRWQCYWIEREGPVQRYYLKKAGRSYLRIASGADLTRFLQRGSEGP